jgi:hypothetical protein
MFQAIQKIVAIFSGYGNGKFLEKKNGKTWKKVKVKDVVSISDEARKRCNSVDDEVTPRHIDEM